MKHKFTFNSISKMLFLGSILVLGLALLPSASVLAKNPTKPLLATVSTAFMYQGQLSDGGGPVTDTCDFTFTLYDAASGGNQIGSTVTANGTSVTNGSFSVELDFGADAFTGDARYLEITVDCGDGSTTLSPRQELQAVPYALGLRPGATIEGTGTLVTASSSGGTNAAAFYGESSSSSGRGVTGVNTASSGSPSGVRGEVNSTDSGATGVYGLAISSSATGSGVKGQNNGTNGYGVWGQGGSGATGVLGQTNSSSRYGVWAYNSGTGVGLRAESQSGNIIEARDLDDAVNAKFTVANDGMITGIGGIDISGGSSDSLDLTGSGNVVNATSTGGTNNAAVFGQTASSVTRGVYGLNTSTSGSTAGVRGEVNSTASGATGVFGLAVSSSATGSGVKGQNNGTNGYGVWGQGGSGATGVLGQTGSSSDYGVWALNTSSGVALRVEGGGNLIEAWDTSPVNLRFRVDNAGNVTADGGFTSPAADFAEMLPAVSGLEPADVLVIGQDGQLTLSTEAYQPTVAGVYSTKPAFLGGAGVDADLTGQIPLAVVGIVPVKVSAENGTIAPGDMLVASDTPGHAMRAEADAPNGTVIGKALSGLDAETGVIQMLVILQ